MIAPNPQMAGDAYSDISLDQAAALGAGGKAATPELGFFERVKLGFKQGGNSPDWGFNELDHTGRAYREIHDELAKRGYFRAGDPFDNVGVVNTGNDELRRGRSYAEKSLSFATYDGLWRAYAAERGRDPGFLPKYREVADHRSLIGFVNQEMNANLADVEQAAPDGLGVAGLIGQFGAGFRDPLNFAGGLPIAPKGGIARRILVAGGVNAATNMAVTGAVEPLVRQSAAKRGIERTTDDFLTDLTVAGVVGGTFGVTFEAVPHVAGKIREKFAGQAAPAPDPLAPAGPTPAAAPPPFETDIDVARAFARAVPPEQRTPDQQAALNVISRDAEIDASSPFVAGPEGDSAHTGWLDLAMGTLAGDAPPARPRNAVTRETIAGGTADVSALRNPPREQLKARIHRGEATAANDFNEASGATGPYQFVARTWVSLFRRRYPNDKRSFAQVAALRRDPHLNEVLMDDLIAENAAALKAAGLPETSGTLYLAHFLGHDRAVTVLRAHPDTPIGRLLPDEYFADNPWMKRDWTAGRLNQWAHQKMGGEAPAFEFAQTGEASTAAAPEEVPDVQFPSGRYDVEAMLGIAGEGADRPILRPELFDSPEDHAAAQRRFEADRDGAEGFAPVRSADELFEPGAHFAALRRYKGTVTAEAMGEAMGISPDQVRRAVQSMQSLSRSSPFILARSRGAEPGALPDRIMRRPRRPAQRTTLVEFLAESGGLSDRGGDLKSMDAHLWRQTKKFRKQVPLINRDGMALDDAMTLAIEAGYFPEFNHTRDPLRAQRYEDLPDPQVLLDAIDAELRGKPRYDDESLLPDEHAVLEEQIRRHGEAPPEGFDDAAPAHISERLADMDVATDVMTLANSHGLRLDDDTLVEAVDMVVDSGLTPGEALDAAIAFAAVREADYAAGVTGEAIYASDNQGRHWTDDDFDFAEPDPDGTTGREAGAGGRRPADPAGQAALDRAFAEQSQDGAEAQAFDDPVGPAAADQADSLTHDLAMLDPEEGASYRLDDEGGEADLKSILDEIEAARKSAAEMRACLKPAKGGGE